MPERPLDAGSGNDRVSGVHLALDGVVDDPDGGAGAHVQRRRRSRGTSLVSARTPHASSLRGRHQPTYPRLKPSARRCSQRAVEMQTTRSPPKSGQRPSQAISRQGGDRVLRAPSSSNQYTEPVGAARWAGLGVRSHVPAAHHLGPRNGRTDELALRRPRSRNQVFAAPSLQGEANPRGRCRAMQGRG